MSCLPGSPCYNSNHTTYPRGCGIDPCKAYQTGSDLVKYNGPNLPCTGINTCETLTLALEKIDNAICNVPTVTLTASNGLYKTGDDVRLGGTLTEVTAITTSYFYTLAIPGLVEDTTPDYFVTQDNVTGVLRKTAPFTANNGLTKTLQNVQLGGGLVKDTVIDGTAYTLWIKNNTAIGNFPPFSPTSSNYTTTLRVNKSLSLQNADGLFTSSSAMQLGGNTNDTFSCDTYAAQTNQLGLEFSAILSLNPSKTYTATSSFVFFNSRDVSGGNIAASTTDATFLDYDLVGHVGGDLDKYIGYRAKAPIASGGNNYNGTIAEVVGVQIDNQRAYMAGGSSGSITQSYGILQLGTRDENYLAGTLKLPNISGTTTLVGGTKTVSASSVTTTSKIFVSCNTPGGTQGFLSAPTASIVQGVSFVINSSSALDTSTVNWVIIN